MPLPVGKYRRRWTTPAAQHFQFVAARHDFGPKTILGQTGTWDGDDIIRILLEQPACSRFLARKLYRYFINDNVTPPKELIEPLAEQMRKSDYDLLALVKMILSSRHFYSAHAYRRNVKSPIDFCLGVARLFGTGQNRQRGDRAVFLIATLGCKGNSYLPRQM